MAEDAMFTEWSASAILLEQEHRKLNGQRQQEEMAAMVSATDAVRLRLPSLKHDTASSSQPQPAGDDLLRYVAGLDTSTVDQPDMGFGDKQRAVACISICELPDFEELDLNIPYRSGYLGFREVPAYSTLLARLKARCEGAHASSHTAAPVATIHNPCDAATPAMTTCSHSGTAVWPQVVLVDGFGVLHHRRCGSASHLGVQWNIPTVGVGKTLLQWDGLNERHVRDTIGRGLEALKEGHDLPAGCYTQTTPRGESVACMDLIGEGSDDVLGVAVAGMHATQRPIYISRGHMVSQQTAVDVTLACCTCRIPEPIRQADLTSRECVRKLLQHRKEATA